MQQEEEGNVREDKEGHDQQQGLRGDEREVGRRGGGGHLDGGCGLRWQPEGMLKLGLLDESTEELLLSRRLFK